MSKTVTLTIDGQTLTVPAGYSIWEAAHQVGINIPNLCHHPALRPEGSCRVCVVKVKGARNLSASCVTKVTEGMEVSTHTPEVLAVRKNIVELLLANHPRDCLSCARSGNCELQKIASDMGIRKIPYNYNRPPMKKDEGNPSITRDPAKCILCGRCVRVCSEVQGIGVYGFTWRGINSRVSPAFDLPLDKATCTYCGQCAKVCPTGAITVHNDTDRVWAALRDPEKIVMVQTAPSVRVGLSEALGGKPGDIVTGKMVAALRQLGFDKVFDTNWSADLTIMEEGTEFINRLKNGGVLPMITSCSPGWVNYMEMFYPELIPHFSTAKSPQAMFGTMLKTYYAQKMNIDPAKIVSVSIMPCTAKKFEAQRPELSASGFRDVDIVLTTVELGQMIREAGLNFQALPDEQYDPLMGIGSGAGTIFGTTGGVMEAAVRTAYELLTGKGLDPLELAPVRGMEGIKEATLTIGKTKVKVAVAHNLSNARKVCEAIKAGNPHGWHFIEIMACPGGCINGGGQPISLEMDTPVKRQEALYTDDRNLPIRKSHENPEVQALYKEFLGEPNGHKAHQLLHTHYREQVRG